MNDNTNSTNNSNNRSNLIKISVITTIVAALLAVVTQFFIIPAFNENSANDKLQKITAKSGTLTAVNTKLVPYNGTRISGTNSQQKALSISNVKPNDTSFMYSNGKKVDQKTVDVYVDLTSKQSRDFLLINEGNLKNLVESGQINLNIHPVPSSNPNSLLYSEAISESINTTPNKSWNFLYSLLKDDIVTDGNSSVSHVIDNIVSMAKKNGISDIDAKSVSNGTFGSWLVDASKDERLNTGYYPPIIYVSNNLIDKNTNINDPNTLRKVVLQ